MTQQQAATTPETAKTGHRVQKVGRVVSDKMDKTRVVVVETLKKHRIYKRTYKQTKRFHVHDEENLSHLDDVIRIEESRPMSKLKRWRLVEIVKYGSGIVPVDEALAQVTPDLQESEVTDEESEVTDEEQVD
jgi:small subunit ribosomal protein S17